MKLLVLLGSPRKDGNSEMLARTVTESLQQKLSCEVEFVRLAPLKISPCIGCGGCRETGECVVKDNMTDLYPKVDAADIIFLVSPTYFYGLSAQTKAFVDRSQALWSRKYLMNILHRQGDKRQGYLLCTAATQGKRLFEGSILVAKSHFDAVNVKYGGELLVRGVDDKGALLEHTEALEEAREFSRLIAREFAS